MSTTMTAAAVVTAVRRHFGAEADGYGPEWAALDEFRAVGLGRSRADVFLVRAWQGKPKGHERILVEVKVARSDLLHELANPEKMATIGRYAHRRYFACPAGLVRDTDDLGPGIGLLEVHPSGVRETRRSGRADVVVPLPEAYVVEVFRRAARAEARIRDAQSDDATAQIVRLRQELDRSQAAENRARAAADRDARRLSEWMRVIAQAGGAPCVCGARLKRPLTPYQRVNHADGTPCAQSPYTDKGLPDVDALVVRLGLTEETPQGGAA